jgi:hypothetical protein
MIDPISAVAVASQANGPLELGSDGFNHLQGVAGTCQ